MLPYTNTCFYATPPTLLGEYVVVLYTPIAKTIKHYNETFAIYMIVILVLKCLIAQLRLATPTRFAEPTSCTMSHVDFYYSMIQ